jgi:hypothetical protein
MMPIPRWKDGLLWIFGLLLFAAFLGVFAPEERSLAQVGPPNSILCNNLAQTSTVTAPVASAVLTVNNSSGAAVPLRGIAGKVIYVCGWHITNGTSAVNGTFQIVGGTDVATTPGCGGTQTVLTPTYDVTNTAPGTDHIEFASLNLLAGQQLCVTTTGAASMHIGIWIGQY